MPRPNQARVVVAGEPTQSQKLAGILTEAGHPVREAGTFEECLKLIGEEVPEVVVIHSRPAESRGLELCRKLRENPYSAGAAVLLISTAFSKSAERVAGL